jgi:hypothetical protein
MAALFECSVCSALAKHLLGSGQWPELPMFMVQASQAAEARMREVRAALDVAASSRQHRSDVHVDIH